MIQTDDFSARLRAKAVRPDTRELLVADFTGSDQEGDLTELPNCGGVGRIRHFTRATSDGWPENSLPIDPALTYLGLARADAIRAQVFQNAACNWRCWYCFVPFNLLGADEKRGAWVTANALVEQFLVLPDRPDMIDLTGGQPDLAPEWVPWTLQALQSAGVADSVYLWSDDNLSNDYFFRYLSDDVQRMVAEHPGTAACAASRDSTRRHSPSTPQLLLISSTVNLSCSLDCSIRGWISTPMQPSRHRRPMVSRHR